MIKKNNLCVSLTGAHSIIISIKDNNFREILSEFLRKPTRWNARSLCIKGAKEMVRCYGTVFFRDTMIATKD